MKIEIIPAAIQDAESLVDIQKKLSNGYMTSTTMKAIPTCAVPMRLKNG